MIPVHSMQFSGNERKYLLQCIDDGWVSSEGPFVKKLEEAFATYHGMPHAIAVSNGSAALELALHSLGLRPGDEVILPTFTIISCLLAVLRSGATPVLVDCDPYTWNMRPEEVIEKITDRTRAIMIVHIYGLPVQMEEIRRHAQERSIVLIEDCAELLGQTYLGKLVGSFGDIATFSLYANKNVTSGEGGMIICRNEHYAERCRSFRNLCFKKEQRFVHDEMGWNYRLSNLQAAVGLAQFEQLSQTIEKKRAIAARYNELLGNLTTLQLSLPKTEYAENLYWIYGVVLTDEVKFDAREAMRRLSQRGVETRPFFWCLHQQPFVKERELFRSEAFPHAERLARRGFYVPSGIGLKEEQIEQVARELRAIF